MISIFRAEVFAVIGIVLGIFIGMLIGLSKR
jgi:TctA family transporter